MDQEQQETSQKREKLVIEGDNMHQIIKAQCAALGVSLYKMCEDLGFSYDSLRKWSVKKPKTVDTLQKIDEYLDLVAKSQKSE